MKRRRHVAVVVGIALTFVAAAAVEQLMDLRDPPPLHRASDLSTEVLARDGSLLRPFTNSKGRWRLAMDLDRLDPRYVELLLAYEDRRFWHHAGVDPLALTRAAWQLATSGRVVSGGSTITMQLARLIEPRPRTFAAKLHQIRRAIQIERRLSKREILEFYLTLAPYGGNIEGLRAASLAWFGRGIGHLPPAEAALLVALPQSPEARRPDRRPAAARAARDRVLDRAAEAGILSLAEIDRAKARSTASHRRPMPALAAHLTADLAAGATPGTRIASHLDRPLQGALEAIARNHASQLGRRGSVAILVAEHDTGRVRAHVGAPDAFDAARFGPIDMTGAVRSPGSALKPFIYGLAFEAGLAHPETLIEDRPTDFSGYAPRNFDNEWRGTVSMREALSMSLNIPAVNVLETVGPERFLARLARGGAKAIVPDETAPGLAVALGGVGLTLADLVRLYGGLARAGAPMALVSSGETPTKAKGAGAAPLLSPVSAWYVTDILTATPPPEAAIPGRIAYKTGTSFGYRDAWAIGFDGDHVIGVWAGRPDGSPVAGLSGHTSAAPILFEAFARLPGGLKPLGPPPKGTTLATNVDLPAPMRRFGATGPALRAAVAAQPLSIAFPPPGARLETGDAGNTLALKAAGGRLPLTWFANGRPVATSDRRRQTFWRPDGPGFSDLAVVDAAGEAARVTVYLE